MYCKAVNVGSNLLVAEWVRSHTCACKCSSEVDRFAFNVCRSRGLSPKGSPAIKAKERKTVMRMGPDNGREVFYCGCIADSGRHVCPWPVLIQEMQPECDWWYAFANVHTPCPSVGGLGKPPRSLGCSVMWKQLAASGFTQCQYVWDNKGECRSAVSHRYTAVALTFF